jgi:uncharacterized membrane protein
MEMVMLTKLSALTATLITGALFGFFYAWVCSAMYGLDATDPRTAIQAMQSINASVRNAVFFPVFFLTPVALALTSAQLFVGSQRSPALFFGLAAVTAGFLAIGLTIIVHIPMNEALAGLEVPSDIAAAQAIWDGYSPDWQFWNVVRTVTSGVALAFAALGLMEMKGNAETA